MNDSDKHIYKEKLYIYKQRIQSLKKTEQNTETKKNKENRCASKV